MTVLNGIIPCLTIDGAARAIDFYKQAFGAEEVSRKEAEDGKRLMHAHLRINGSDLMMWDLFPEFGMSADRPHGVTIHLEVDDADTWYQRAEKAGATPSMPLDNTFWGARYGQLLDPFGHCWAIGGPIKP
ncbi:VOC family protein [Nitratireductor soli]|uniref:VOC family protein n=1 Tax=Nitratireductor soli TaxID=1670619 RepID=UPI000A3D8FDC|nr:glyoxalase/bleomycin resistance/extradiol dioxygenase family protein [Nitratireductor soli]